MFGWKNRHLRRMDRYSIGGYWMVGKGINVGWISGCADTDCMGGWMASGVETGIRPFQMSSISAYSMHSRLSSVER